MAKRLTSQLTFESTTQEPAGHDLSEPVSTRRRGQAEDFLRSFQLEEESVDQSRIREALAELDHTGHYAHTLDELRFGARVAWRNTLDCVGRAHWRRLEVIDARSVATTDEMFDACVEHLRRATNGGKVQLVMTVFPERRPGEKGFRIWNSQLVRYAAYRAPNGSIVGDPDCVSSTELAESLGWQGSGGPFDVLPLMLQVPGSPIRYYEIPDDVVLQVPISHPTLSGLDALGLRWYAHPAICNQRMEIGGLSYTAAPFSGWYTAAEVAARDLGDPHRYNVLPDVAAAIGLDTRSDRTLWKERALLELTLAVLHSYDAHGVTIVDHHVAAASFARHEQRERTHGREVNGRWSKLVPASAPATTEIFHRDYSERVVLPNFFRQPIVPPSDSEPTDRSTQDGS